MRTDPLVFMSLTFIIWRYLLRGVAPHTLPALCIPIAIWIVDKFLFIEGYLEDPEGTELMRTDPVAFMSLNFIIWKYLLRGVTPHTLPALCIPIAIGIVDNFLFMEDC
jgi:hypothetical protein